MRRWLPAVFLLEMIACGGTGSGPSPVPVPIPAPAPTPAPAAPPVIQPDPALFDAVFNAQLIHNGFEQPGALEPSRILPADPSIYLQANGLSAATVTALEAAARAVVPAMSGGLRHVASFETGSAVRPDAAGWISVELVNDDAANCGRAVVGASAGHIWLNTAAKCGRRGSIIGTPSILAHEIGHSLGFWHVQQPDALMNAVTGLDAVATDRERYHAGLAYQSNGAYSTQRMIVVD